MHLEKENLFLFQENTTSQKFANKSVRVLNIHIQSIEYPYSTKTSINIKGVLTIRIETSKETAILDAVSAPNGV